MNFRKSRAWILSAAMTAGVATLPATFAYAKDSPREEWVKYEDVPRDVRQTLDKERGRYDIKRIDKVTRNGRTFYRAVLDTRGGQDTLVRVGDNGRLLSCDEIADLDPQSEAATGDEKWVKYEDLPRAVRNALDQQRGNHEVKKITDVNRNGREFYRAIIDTKGDDSVVRIDTRGRVLSRADVDDVAVGNERGVQRDRSAAAASDRAEHTAVKYNSLPAAVKDTLDRERGNRDVKIIYEVHRGDRTYYNAIVDERTGDRSVRITPGGKLLSQEDLREVRTAGARYDSSSYDLRRGVDDDGQRVAFDRLPGQVKTTIGREAGQDRVGNVYEYDRRGQRVYEAEAYSPAGTRIIRVDENGRLVNDRDATAEGRRSLNFQDLPGQVKESIGREAGSSKIGRVVQLTENGHTYYRAQLDNGRSDSSSNWITVDEKGRVVRDFDRGR
jgi:hypothetical protein